MKNNPSKLFNYFVKASSEKQSNRNYPLLIFIVSSIIFLLLTLWGGLFGIIGKHPLHIPFTDITIHSGRFMFLFAITWTTGLLLFLVWPRTLSNRQTIMLMLILATIARITLIPAPPSDDINRYLWEGKVLNAGISPYAVAPNAKELTKFAATDPYHAQINHPHMPAAYPPLVIELFALIGLLSYTPLAIKLLLIICDIGTLWGIILLLQYRSLPIRWAAIYAFNPIVLYAFAGHAHFDAIQMLFIVLTLILYDRKQWVACFLMAGLIFQAKYVGILIFPFLLRRDNLKYAPLAAITAVIPYLPIIILNPHNLFYCIIAFGNKFAFNGSIHAILMALTGSLSLATILTKAIFVTTIITGYFFFHPQLNPSYKNDPISGSFFVLGALIILSPTVHFWYLTWIIPFLCIRYAASWLILTFTTGLYFVTNGIMYHTGEWILPPTAQILEWTPFLLLLAREAYLTIRKNQSKNNDTSPSNISVIIPTLNEAEQIATCIQNIQRDPAIKEIIVVDGNSIDNTATRAIEAGATVIHNHKTIDNGGGRGGQILTGINYASSDIIAIVHADTIVTKPEFSNILSVLQKQPMVIGGSIGSTFDSQGSTPTLLPIGNDAKSALAGISFGDQVQFFRRRPIVKNNIFPDLPLMEDLELALRLKTVGNTVHLFGNAVVSARHWKNNEIKRTIMILGLLISYFTQRLWKQPDIIKMYRKYYKKQL